MRNKYAQLILIAITALYNQPSNAGLVASTSSSAGSRCYLEDTKLVVIACQCGTGGCTAPNLKSLPECTQEYNGTTTCSLGTSGEWSYYCDFSNADTCNICGLGSNMTTNWSVNRNTMVATRNIKTYADSNNSHKCELKSSKTEYGCYKGFYTTSSSPSANMTCLLCPNGGTTSDTGNTKGITSCYMPSGRVFEDDTGSGTYTGDCYYSN